MDGEVNNRTARITQDVKRDNTDAGDRQTQQTHKMDNRRQTQQTQTHKMDRRNKRRRTQTDTTDADETQEMDNRRERLSVGNELTSE